MALTITEALAEIKTIVKRIEAKRSFVAQYLGRQDALRDPLENQGGSRKAIESERQGIGDLEARIVFIRAAIQKANTDTRIVIGRDTRSIADWLVWRREVAPNAKAFLGAIQNAVKTARQQATQKGIAVRSADAPEGKPSDVIINVDEKTLADEIEGLEVTLGTLDGQLSLKNATTIIEV